MIGPIARWAIKQALLQTAKAVDTKIATNKKAEREAAIRQEEEREAADPTYRAYKDAIREKVRIAEEESQRLREIEDRKQARRDLVLKLLWRGSLGMYAICVLYRLYAPSFHAYHSSTANILASMWILTVLALFYDLRGMMVNGIDPYQGLGCGVTILITLCWLGYVLLECIRV